MGIKGPFIRDGTQGSFIRPTWALYNIWHKHLWVWLPVLAVPSLTLRGWWSPVLWGWKARSYSLSLSFQMPSNQEKEKGKKETDGVNIEPEEGEGRIIIWWCWTRKTQKQLDKHHELHIKALRGLLIIVSECYISLQQRCWLTLPMCYKKAIPKQLIESLMRQDGTFVTASPPEEALIHNHFWCDTSMAKVWFS